MQVQHLNESSKRWVSYILGCDVVKTHSGSRRFFRGGFSLLLCGLLTTLYYPLSVLLELLSTTPRGGLLPFLRGWFTARYRLSVGGSCGSPTPILYTLCFLSSTFCGRISAWLCHVYSLCVYVRASVQTRPACSPRLLLS